jgi:hypothetical protein
MIPLHYLLNTLYFSFGRRYIPLFSVSVLWFWWLLLFHFLLGEISVPVSLLGDDIRYFTSCFSFGRWYLTSMGSTLQGSTTEILIFSWKELTFILMRQMVSQSNSSTFNMGTMGARKPRGQLAQLRLHTFLYNGKMCRQETVLAQSSYRPWDSDFYNQLRTWFLPLKPVSCFT